MSNEKREMRNEEYKREKRREKREKKYEVILEPEFYQVIPGCGTDIDVPFHIQLSAALKRIRNLQTIKAVYYAGYKTMSNDAFFISHFSFLIC
jgi:hypothetical protein